MDVKQIVMLAVQVSILATVFGFGLKATVADLTYLLRRPGLLARSLLAMFVIMPLLVVAMVRLLPFPTNVEIVLVALAISPVPPLLPRREVKAGGLAPYGLGLMVVLATVSIVAVPLMVEILGRYFGRPLGVPPAKIAGILLRAALLPLAAGVIVHAVAPAVAERLAVIARWVARILLPLAVVILLAGSLSSIWEVMAPGTLLAIAIFVVAGLAIGHVLGGPDRDHSVVLALSTACRHPAIALTLAATNFPEQRFIGTMLLYLLLNAVLGVPYILWQKRRA